MKKLLLLSILVVMSLPGIVSVAQAELPPLIPREVLFGRADRSRPRVSPDGKMLAYIRPYEGTNNVWVRTIGTDDDKPIKKGRGFNWYHDSKHIIFRQRKDGDKIAQFYLRDIETCKDRRISNITTKKWGRILARAKKPGDDMILAIKSHLPGLRDAYRLNLETGELTMVAENTANFMGWLVDHDKKVRAAMTVTEDATRIIYVRDDENSPWRELISWGFEDSLTSGGIRWLRTKAGVAFTADNRGIYVTSNTGTNTNRICEVDIATGKVKTIHHDKESDVSGVFMHPRKHTIQAVLHQKERPVWSVLDPDIKEDFEVLKNVQGGNFNIISRSDDDSIWTVSFNSDDKPITFYLYDRKTKKAEFLFTEHLGIEKYTFAKTEPIKFKSRDGLTIHGYLTIPPGLEARNLPMVANIHGGPWNRDKWGWNNRNQWLANRGYAVLQINFRGSTSYGKEFLNASILEFGGKMDDDVVDGVKWAFEKGIADPKRTAIFGSSGGGWAVLVGMTRWPDLYCCGVDFCGPSNILTFYEGIPPYWKIWESIWQLRMGHPVRDRDLVIAHSPFFKVDRVKNPIMIAQGANDDKVDRYESIQMALALKRAGKVVEFVEYHNEGHGFGHPENRIDFHRRAEKFLAKYVGGRYEE